VILAPGIWFAATHYGAVGAAFIWILLNGTYLAAGLPLTHTRLLRGEGAQVVRRDLAMPVFASVAAILLLAGLLPVAQSSSGVQVVLIGLVVSTGALVAAAAAPDVRAWLRAGMARRLAH
jgi:hypothetical protein